MASGKNESAFPEGTNQNALRGSRFNYLTFQKDHLSFNRNLSYVMFGCWCHDCRWRFTFLCILYFLCMFNLYIYTFMHSCISTVCSCYVPKKKTSLYNPSLGDILDHTSPHRSLFSPRFLGFSEHILRTAISLNMADFNYSSGQRPKHVGSQN